LGLSFHLQLSIDALTDEKAAAQTMPNETTPDFEYNKATDGRTSIEAEYLEVVATRA